jgi:hypothetical protein
MKNRMAMYEISIKIVFLICMFYNMVFKKIRLFSQAEMKVGIT